MPDQCTARHPKITRRTPINRPIKDGETLSLWVSTVYDHRCDLPAGHGLDHQHVTDMLDISWGVDDG